MTTARFEATSWTAVTLAGAAGDSSVQALAYLCGQYWPPVYAFIRRHGRNQEDAKDLTQAFFEHLLEGDLLARARKDKGKFRSFLLAAVRNFLSNVRTSQHAQKRGGGRIIISLDDETAGVAESDFLAHAETPDLQFERAWMRVILTQVLATVRHHYAARGKLRAFEVLVTFVSGDSPEYSHAEAATLLRSTESAVKSAIHRLRLRCAQEVRREIGLTVLNNMEVDEELRRFHAVFALVTR